MRRCFACAFAITACLCVSVKGNADVIVTLTESGGDVSLSAVGTIDLSGFTAAQLPIPVGGFINPSAATYAIGPAALTANDLYSASGVGPAGFGTGVATEADTGLSLIHI